MGDDQSQTDRSSLRSRPNHTYIPGTQAPAPIHGKEGTTHPVDKHDITEAPILCLIYTTFVPDIQNQPNRHLIASNQPAPAAQPRILKRHDWRETEETTKLCTEVGCPHALRLRRVCQVAGVGIDCNA